MSDTAEPKDERNLIYRKLHSDQLNKEKPPTEYSSRRVLEIVFGLCRPKSVLDVGCGLGIWLKTALSLGATEVKGIEGEWVDPGLLEVPLDVVEIRDLEKSFDLKRKFDLVICLEVAEHLSETVADGFIASLVRHGPVVLFSAAIPFQGGEHHVNERFLPYWAEKFANHGYRPLDFIRSEIWEDAGALLWLRQNAMIFAHEDLIAANEDLRLASLNSRFPLSVVHPEFHFRRSQESEKLRAYLRVGGFYRATPVRDADVEVQRITKDVEEMRKLKEYMMAGGFYYATAADAAGEFSVVRADGRVGELERLRDYMQAGGLFVATPTETPGGVNVAKASGIVEELQRLRDYISSGGLFRVTVNASGTLSVTKVGETADSPPAGAFVG